jgi:uncharacterized caspase-like protein
MSPRGSLIAFATSPGTASLDGLPTERNSIYTKHLLNQLRIQPHLSVSDLLTQVAGGVAKETNQEQWPWKSDSLIDRFCFGTCGSGEQGKLERQRAELERHRYIDNGDGTVTDNRISFIVLMSPSTYASRLALVIGNNDYIHESPLNSPVNDAKDMAKGLRGLGFTVIAKYNLKQRDFDQVVSRLKFL